MNTTAARIALHRATRTLSFPVLFKSAFGLALASLTLFEVAASFVPYKPTDGEGIIVAALGLGAGAMLAVWK